MTLNIFLTAVRATLSTALGSGAVICPADDEFSALEGLAAGVPQGLRVVVFCGDLTAVEGDGTGSVCRLATRIVVQVKRGLAIDATVQAESELLHAAEHVRLVVMAMRFQLADPDPAYSEPHGPVDPRHPSVSGFTHEGSGSYQGPIADVLLEHPARELRFTNLIALDSPSESIAVPLPA